MALYGSLPAVRALAAGLPGFEIAFRYLEELLKAGSPIQARLRAVTSGESEKVDLGGGVFVIEQAYETRLRADGFFESHRKYVDIQAVLDGEETMEVADILRMTERQPYSAERDLIVYEDSSDASLLRVHAGQMAVFFPPDVHMPTLRIRSDPVLVRKAVLKVPVLA
ncbi:MAG: YhcH/YjgK/YiaL family protein [Opitutus sp.]